MLTASVRFFLDLLDQVSSKTNLCSRVFASRALQAGTTMAVGSFLIVRAMQRRRKKNLMGYPPARRSDHHDTYWGEDVADPYRWMEGIFTWD